MDIAGNYDEIFIESDESGAAPARRRRNRALNHPVFFNKLLDDLGDSTPLKTGMARQFSSRDRLVLPDKL
jgi:hypothetical protein